MTQLIQATVIISIALIFYRTLLEKETHYRLNRWILLSCMVLAFLLPQLGLKLTVPAEIFDQVDISLPFSQKEIVYTPAWEPTPLPTENPLDMAEYEEITEIIPETIGPESKSSWVGLVIQKLSFKDFLLYLYIGGVLVMCTRFLVQIFSLVHQIKIHPKNKEGKYILVQLREGKASYSFFNFIFINPKPLDHATYKQVLSHEMIHVDQKHSLDILFSQLLLISQWFNPFAWMYKKKVQQNLEYLTDDLMLKQGTDISDYQFSLLRVSAPGPNSQLVLNYSQSLLKKRILMMNTKKSSLSSVWKYLFLLPVLALSSFILIAEKAPDFPENLVESIVEQESPPFSTEKINPSEGNVLEKTTEASPLETTPSIFPVSFNSTEDIIGKWEAKIAETEICIRIFRSLSNEDWNWMNFDCYEHSEFSPKVTNSTTSFNLKRKAGSLDFTGTFSGKKGEGSFEFVGSDAYRKELANKGVQNASDDLLFRLFFVRNEAKFIDNLIALQKLGLDENTLQTLMVDGVKASLVKGYQDEGLSVTEHFSFIRGRVKADLIKSYKDAGLDVTEHKGFVNSRVKPDLLMAYQNAGLDLEEHKSFINSRVKPDMLMAYKNAGFDLQEYKGYINSRVKPELLKEYQTAGFDLKEYKSYINSRVKPKLLTAYRDAGFDPAEYTSYIQSRVKPELLKSYQDAGLDIKEYNNFIQSRVKPEVLKEYKDAGYDLAKYTSYIHSRVSPSLLKSYEKAGFDLDTYNSYIQSRVKPELLTEYKDAGFSPDKYRSFIQSRVKPGILKGYKDAGFDLETHKSFIHSRVKPELLKSYKDAGLDLEKHKRYIHSRVDPSMISAYTEAGFDLETYDKYLQSRIRPSFLKEYKSAGLDIKKYEKFVHSRVSAEFLNGYIKAGYDPNSYSDFIHRRIKADFLKSYEKAGLDIEEHKDFIMDRVDPEKVQKYRDAQKNKN